VALIVLGSSWCPLCGRVLHQGDELVATSHFIADPRDPLWCYSDAGMHRSCFLTWEHREAFRVRYNEAVRRFARGTAALRLMSWDGSVEEDCPEPGDVP
jgi:hypothetical protein